MLNWSWTEPFRTSKCLVTVLVYRPLLHRCQSSKTPAKAKQSVCFLFRWTYFLRKDRDRDRQRQRHRESEVPHRNLKRYKFSFHEPHKKQLKRWYSNNKTTTPCQHAGNQTCISTNLTSRRTFRRYAGEKLCWPGGLVICAEFLLVTLQCVLLAALVNSVMLYF